MSTVHVLVGLGPGPTTGLRLRLAGDRSVLGRAADCDIRLPHDGPVGPRHALIRVRDGCPWVQDLGSSGGTFVNGRRLGAAAHALRRGDVVVFGTVALRYETVVREHGAPPPEEHPTAPQRADAAPQVVVRDAGDPDRARPPRVAARRRCLASMLLGGAIYLTAALTLLAAVLEGGDERGSLVGWVAGGIGLVLVATGLALHAATGVRIDRRPNGRRGDPGTVRGTSRHTATTRRCR